MDKNSFFGALFDFSFSQFVTKKVIKVIYIIGMIGIGLGTLGYIGMAFMMFGQSVTAGLGMLIMSPIAGVLSLLMLRVYMELVIVMFNIADNTAAIAGQKKTTEE